MGAGWGNMTFSTAEGCRAGKGDDIIPRLVAGGGPSPGGIPFCGGRPVEKGEILGLLAADEGQG